MVATRDLAHRFPEMVAPFDRFALLVFGQLRLPDELDAASFGAGAPLADAHEATPSRTPPGRLRRSAGGGFGRWSMCDNVMYLLPLLLGGVLLGGQNRFRCRLRLN